GDGDVAWVISDGDAGHRARRQIDPREGVTFGCGHPYSLVVDRDGDRAEPDDEPLHRWHARIDPDHDRPAHNRPHGVTPDSERAYDPLRLQPALDRQRLSIESVKIAA